MSLGVDSLMRVIAAGAVVTVPSSIGVDSCIRLATVAKESKVRIIFKRGGKGVDSLVAIASAAPGLVEIDCSE